MRAFRALSFTYFGETPQGMSRLATKLETVWRNRLGDIVASSSPERSRALCSLVFGSAFLQR